MSQVSLSLACLCRSCAPAPQVSGPPGPPWQALGSVIHLGRCPDIPLGTDLNAAPET